MTRIRASLWAFSAAALLSAGPAPPSADGALWARKDAEKLLRTAAVVDVARNQETGRTMAWSVRLEKEGGQVRAVFKHINRPRPQPQAASFRYELAAYEIAGLLDVDIVPPTVEREIAGTKGALQLFVEGCQSERDRERTGANPPDPALFLQALDTIRVFELLTGAECGSKDDTLIQKDSWKVCRVDFSEAFPADPALAPDCPLARCPARLYNHLLRTARAAVVSRVRPYLSDSEINSLCERKKRIVARIQELIKEKGEREVLF